MFINYYEVKRNDGKCPELLLGPKGKVIKYDVPGIFLRRGSRPRPLARKRKKSMNEGEVYFALFGDEFEPDEVTKIIGIEPTNTRRKGNPIPRCTSWEYSTGMIEDEVVDVFEMSSSLIATLAPHAEKIIKAKEMYGLRAVLEVILTVTSDDSKSTPAIGFESDVITFLHKVGATIDIDTYRGES